MGTDFDFISIENPDDHLRTPAALSHSAFPVSASMMGKSLVQLVNAHREKKILIFCQRKSETTEYASLLPSTRILSGDIAQRERDKAIYDIKNGHASRIIATDVAARGLDIPDMDLVIHVGAPADIESYIHRSGRTARAGKSGESILMFDPADIDTVRQIQQEVGVSFKRTSIPQISPNETAQKFLNDLPPANPYVQTQLRDTVDKILEDPQKTRSILLNLLGGQVSLRSLLTLDPAMATIMIQSPKNTKPEPREILKHVENTIKIPMKQWFQHENTIFADVPQRYLPQIVKSAEPYEIEPAWALPENILLSDTISLKPQFSNYARNQKNSGSYQRGNNQRATNYQRGFGGSYQRGGSSRSGYQNNSGGRYSQDNYEGYQRSGGYKENSDQRPRAAYGNDLERQRGNSKNFNFFDDMLKSTPNKYRKSFNLR